MDSDLQAENQALRRQLDSLLREARNNEEKMRRFDQSKLFDRMAAKLPIRLHLLIPAVENSVSGSAFRPGDILKSAVCLLARLRRRGER